jgi:hypothetical protein
MNKFDFNLHNLEKLVPSLNELLLWIVNIKNVMENFAINKTYGVC